MKPVSTFIRRKMAPIIDDIQNNQLTLGAAALKHGLSAQRIRQNLRDMGLESLIGEKKSICRRPKQEDKLQLDRVRTLYFSGNSIQHIAASTETTESAVRLKLGASLPDVWPTSTLDEENNMP